MKTQEVNKRQKPQNRHDWSDGNIYDILTSDKTNHPDYSNLN